MAGKGTFALRLWFVDDDQGATKRHHWSGVEVKAAKDLVVDRKLGINTGKTMVSMVISACTRRLHQRLGGNLLSQSDRTAVK